MVLSHLSIRQSLVNATDISGTVKVNNLANTARKARLFIEQQGSTIKTLEFDIPATGNFSTSFSISPGNQGSISARLESKNDPLLLDNNLKLDLAKLQPLIRYKFLGDCVPQLMAVINSHPAFINIERNAELLINCSGQLDASSLPTLMLHQADSEHQTTQTAHWHKKTAMDLPTLAAGLFYSKNAPVLSPSKLPILSADGRLLILKRHGNRNIIDIYIDTSHTSFTRQANYPLLILALISELTEHNLEMTPLMVSRDINASRITALTFSTSSNSRITATTEPTFFITQLLLLLAILLLLLDVVLRLFSLPGKKM